MALSEQAQVAKIIRQWLKSKGLQCSVTSESASMMTAVTVKVFDLNPDQYKEVTDFCSSYQYGHFNGMEDIYENSNYRNDIPQVKYLHTCNEHSDERKQLAYSFLRTRYSGGEELPEDYKQAIYNARLWDEWASTMVYRLLNGSLDSMSEEFWNSLQPAAVTKHVQPAAAGITEHIHTKTGKTFYIVPLTDRMDRDQYLAELDRAKAAGGWYSRRFGDAPNGFAFNTREIAETFLFSCAVLGAEDPGPVSGAKTEEPTLDRSKLKIAADKMQPEINKCFADRQINTPKRFGQAQRARQEGLRLQRTQTVLYRLAESTTLPHITTKKQVYDLMGSEMTPVSNGWHGYHVETGEPRIKTPDALALWALLADDTPALDPLRQKIESLQFSNIPGYFPTPDPVIDRMLELAGDIEPGEVILDPELGSCAIADRLAAAGAKPEGYEVNYSLAEICQLKGFLIDQQDFLEVEPVRKYKHIFMNPPFERGQDIAHIKHAMRFLVPGGQLIAICAGGPRQSAELQNIADTWEQLPAGSFKQAGTLVNTVLLSMEMSQ